MKKIVSLAASASLMLAVAAPAFATDSSSSSSMSTSSVSSAMSSSSKAHVLSKAMTLEQYRMMKKEKGSAYAERGHLHMVMKKMVGTSDDDDSGMKHMEKMQRMDNVMKNDIERMSRRNLTTSHKITPSEACKMVWGKDRKLCVKAFLKAGNPQNGWMWTASSSSMSSSSTSSTATSAATSSTSSH
jgi:hypothetical protein